MQYALFWGPDLSMWCRQPAHNLLLERSDECLAYAIKHWALPGKHYLYVFFRSNPDGIFRFQFLMGGIVVPLVATVGINNKVQFLEKWGTSEFTNSTGAYELDLSLVDDPGLAWREMHVKSDVFCSASIVLPDKGARQLNVGGWSLESTYGVRLYTPDGSPGVNGTNDWEENHSELSLQVCLPISDFVCGLPSVRGAVGTLRLC